MPETSVALYTAFSERATGGSPAGIVSDAALLDAETRCRIVREMDLPVVAFVTGADERSVSAQFRSTLMELPMCGHGTVALMTRMVERDLLDWQGGERIDVVLRLPCGTAAVSLTRRGDGRPLVMLEVRPPAWRAGAVDLPRLARLLGLDASDFAEERPVERAMGDFVHLVAPIRDLAAMRRIAPDFEGLRVFCTENGIETVAAFCSEVERPGSTIHVRDFCPAVGVAESAGAGTTNAALASYLLRHALVRPDGDGRVEVRAEQGHEIGRPSAICSLASVEGDSILRLQVGGVATKVGEKVLRL